MIGTGAREWHPTTWQLWAKSGEEGRWLSIPQHMRDSSAVAGLLWDHWVSDSLRNLLVAETGLASSEVKVLLQWLAGVHDVGKIDPEFIRQLENQSDYSWLVDKARDADLDFRTKPTPGRIPHSHVSDALVAQYLHDQTGLPLGKTRTYSAVVGSHHGLPMPVGDRDRAVHHVEWLSPAWQELQQSALTVMAAETGFDQILDRLPRSLSAPAQMTLTGLVIMTDWIASNTEPARSPPKARTTRQGEQRRPSVTLTRPRLGRRTASGEAEAAFRARFGWDASRHARSVQRLAYELALSCGKVKVVSWWLRLLWARARRSWLSSVLRLWRSGTGPGG